jgi:membrane protein
MIAAPARRVLLPNGMVIGGRNIGVLLKKTGKEIGEDRIALYAAQMAYTLFFSLFPLLIFVAALLGLVVDKRMVSGWIHQQVLAAVPADYARLIQDTIDKVIFTDNAPGLLSFGLLTALWSGSAIFGAFMDALNAAYDVKETRPWWRRQLIRIGAMLAAGVVLLVATVVLVNGEGVIQWIGSHIGLSSVTRITWTVLQYPLAIAAVVGLLWMLYYFLPNCKHQNRKYVWVGAVLAAVLWIAATLLFRLYVQNFGKLNPAYGTVGAIMVLLTWMYYSSFVLLAAGELNAELQCGTGRVGAGAATESGDEDAGVPRKHALVPVAPTREQQPVGPRWAARMRARSDGSGNGRGHGYHRGLRRFALFRVADRVRDTVAFVRDWAEGIVAHLRNDIAVAQREISAMVRSIGVGTLLVACGGVIALCGGLSLIASIVVLVGDQWLPRDRYWVAALLVAAVAGAAALIFARRGRAILSESGTPREMTETPREEERSVRVS